MSDTTQEPKFKYGDIVKFKRVLNKTPLRIASERYQFKLPDTGLGYICKRLLDGEFDAGTPIHESNLVQWTHEDQLEYDESIGVKIHANNGRAEV